MISNYPQGACYSPGSLPMSGTPPMRPSYYMPRTAASPDRSYCMVPYYSYQMMPMYYMPVPYQYSEKRAVSLTSSSSPGEYMQSDLDISNSWEYQAESDWSPHFDTENIPHNSDMPFQCTDWGRQDEASSQDISPQHSTSPVSEHSVSDAETQLHKMDMNTHSDNDASLIECSVQKPIAYHRDIILRFKFLRSDDNTREKMDQLDSPCIQTLFSSTSTFSECADVIIYRNQFSVSDLISAFDDLIEEWGIEADQTPWFVLRILIFLRYKKGDGFNPTLVTNGKSVYQHFISQSHLHLQAKIRNECMSALEEEESSLKFSGSFQEFTSFIPDP